MNGDIGIGKINVQDHKRDAIHIAVAPVIAGEKLHPGQHVGVKDGRAAWMPEGKSIGIVDPFIQKREIQAGDSFYLFLYPGTITSLRHEWVHPAFGDEIPPAQKPVDDKAASEAWLREYAEKVNPYYAPGGYYHEKTGRHEAYEVLMNDLRGNCITYHGVDMHSRGELIDEHLLQHHASIVLGRPVNFDGFEYFSCSC